MTRQEIERWIEEITGDIDAQYQRLLPQELAMLLAAKSQQLQLLAAEAARIEPSPQPQISLRPRLYPPPAVRNASEPHIEETR
jgi:hypothetical protein